MTAASEAITSAACDVGIVEVKLHIPRRIASPSPCSTAWAMTLPVFARFLPEPETLDGRIMRIYRHKAQEMSALFD